MSKFIDITQPGKSGLYRLKISYMIDAKAEPEVYYITNEFKYKKLLDAYEHMLRLNTHQQGSTTRFNAVIA